MKPIISFFVPGKCGTAGSKRAFVVNRKSDGKPVAVVTDDSKSSRDWKGDVKRFGAEEYKGPLLEGPLQATFTFFIARPQFHLGKSGVKESAPKYPIVKPDVLKFARAVEDALTGVLWKDDAQIVTEMLMKRYAVGLAVPGVMIEIEAL